MEIIANIFSFTGHLIDAVTGFLYNEKSKLILFNILSSLCSLLCMILLHSVAGCISVIVTIFRLVLIYYKDKYQWNIDWIFIVFVIGYLGVFLDNNTLVAMLLFLGNVIAFLPKWFCQKAQHLRIGACVANIVFIFPNYLIHNFSAIPFYIFNIVTISLAYYKWHKQERIENKK